MPGLRLLLGMVALVLLASCTGDDVAGDGPEIARPSIDGAGDSIVRIVAFGCGAPALGSGFAVASDLVVTSGHIVTGRDPDTLSVVRPNGEEYAVTLVGFDPDWDLAALRLDEPVLEPVTLVTEVPIVAGVAIGLRAPLGVSTVNEIDFMVDKPVFVNWDGIFRDTESRFHGIRIEAEVKRGDSGSGLFVSDENVIGLIHSKNRAGIPRAYAVSALQIDEFLAATDPETEIVAERCA